MEHIVTKAYLNFSALEGDDRQIVQEGLGACHAFWLAAQQLPNYAIAAARPHDRCIYAALAVRDILNKRGIIEAKAYMCGLQIQLLDQHTGKTKKGIAVGNPEGPSGPKHWNAHLVVRAGNFLFDPTLAQAIRPWNDLPHIGVFRFGAPEWHELSMAGGMVKTTAMALTSMANDRLEIAYFDIPAIAGFENRSHKTSSNSAIKERRDVVAGALRLLVANNRLDFNGVETQTITPTVMDRAQSA